MAKYWTTQNGDEIEYSKLGDNHLQNILRWIERIAENGITITEGGMGGDGKPDWGDVYEISGEEVLEKYDYAGLQKELKKRTMLSTLCE